MKMAHGPARNDNPEGATMNKYWVLCATVFLFASAPDPAQAQNYHPSLSDSFIFSVGAFRSDNAFKISSDRNLLDGINDDIDFGNSIGVDDSSTLLNVQLRWKIGKRQKWSIWGQYFKNDATGDSTLLEDVEWQDLIFREGTFVEGGVKIEVTRLFAGYSFVKNEQSDFGIGAGIHNLDMGAFIGGEIKINDETTGYRRADADASQILPNVGAWYTFSPASKWALHGRVDWISANIGNYDGTMWNTNIGVNFQPFRHFGFDLSYQYFNLNLKVDKEDWKGGADMRYSGPVFSLTANW
jgi:hypothetical protein